MKLIETPSLYYNKSKEYTVKEAISDRLYGPGYDGENYQIDRVIDTLSSLVQMLQERNVLKDSEIEELVGRGYIIKKE